MKSDKSENLRKQALEANTLLASIAESSDDAIIGLTQDGTILSWNYGAQKIYGYSTDEVKGRSISILVPPDKTDEVPQLLRRIRKGQHIEHYETVHMRKDGKQIGVSLTMSPIKDSTGKIIGASTIALDITERKLAEEELQRALDELEIRVKERTAELEEANIELEAEIAERKQVEEAVLARETQLLLILDNVTDVIFTIAVEPNDRFRFKSVNRRFLEVTGLSENQVVGKLAQEVIPEQAHALVFGKYKEAIQNKQSVRWEEVSVYPTGRKVGEVAVAPIFDMHGNCTQLIGIVHDITERKLTEEELRKHRDHLEELIKERTTELVVAKNHAEAADKLKSIFIASMSHELRTPLNSIIGFTGMTLQGLSGELNEEQKDNLSRVSKSARHLLDLITDVIDVSKIEAGRIEVFPAPFELSPLIAEAVSSIEHQVKEKGLELVVDVPPDIKMNTDRKRLLQCIINYLSNAVKFTEAGSVTISIKEVNGDMELSVIDTGIGIAEKDIPRLFEAFERLETHLQIKTGGTGLGLYLTKKIAIELLRGSVGVKSVEGKGSIFSIRIPKILRKGGENK